MSVLTQQPVPAPMLEEEPPSSSGNRRTLLLVGGLVAALAAAAAAYFFLFSGSGTPVPTAVQPPAAAPKASASASASAPAAGSTGTKRSSYPLTSRDPFAPLPSSGAQASNGTSTSSTTSSSSSTGAPAPAAPIATPITFILASVDAKAGTASLSVDGTSYNATVGKVFGKNYMLYAVFNTTCAGVLVGDQSVPICVGHSVAVTP